MELFKSPLPFPSPPASSHSCCPCSSPPPPPPPLPPEISPIDEVLSVFVNKHQKHPLSLPQTNPPPPPSLLPLELSPSDEVSSVVVDEQKSHSLSIPPTARPTPLLLLPDVSSSGDIQQRTHARSFPTNLPPPIPIDSVNNGDIKKCLISELSSPANSLIEQFGKMSIFNVDHFSKFTGSTTVSKGTAMEYLIDKMDDSIIGGDDFRKLTGSGTASKGVTGGEEPIHAGENDSYEADHEGSDSGDDDDDDCSGDGGDSELEGVEEGQLRGDVYPNKGNGSDESLPSSNEAGWILKLFEEYFWIYLKLGTDDLVQLGRIYDYQFRNVCTFQEWEKCIRKRVAKFKVKAVPKHYKVVFEREIPENEQEHKFADVPADMNGPCPCLSRIVLVPEIHYDIYLRENGVLLGQIGSINKVECVAMGSKEDLVQHLHRMVYEMELEEFEVVRVGFEHEITDEQEYSDFIEIPKDFTSLLSILSRIVIDVKSKTHLSQPKEARGSGTKRQNKASRDEACGSSKKRTTGVRCF